MVLHFCLVFSVDVLRLVVLALRKSRGDKSTTSGSHRSTGSNASSLLDVLRFLFFFSCIDFLPMILLP